jgi:hypothetical protein
MSVLRPTRRQAGLIALTAALAALRPAHAQDELRIVIPTDVSEIITTDLKRLRLAEPAAFSFVKTDPAAFEQLFPGDPTRALSYLRAIVLSAARRIFGEMTSAEVLRGDGTPAFVARINADGESIRVALRSHAMRYEPVPPLY